MKKILTYVVVLIALGAALAKPKPPSKAEIEKQDKANWGGVDYSAAPEGENSVANDLAQIRSMTRGESAKMSKVLDYCKSLIFGAKIVDMSPETVLGDALKELGRPIDPTPSRTYPNISATPAQKLGLKSLQSTKKTLAKFGKDVRPKVAALLRASVETRVYSDYNRLVRVTNLGIVKDGSLVKSLEKVDTAWGKYLKILDKVGNGTDRWKYAPAKLLDSEMKKKLFAEVLKESGLDCALDANGNLHAKSSRYLHTLDNYFKHTTDAELKKYEEGLQRCWTAHNEAAAAVNDFAAWFTENGMSLDPYPREFIKELYFAHRDYVHKDTNLLEDCKKVLDNLRDESTPAGKLRKCKGFSPNKAYFLRSGPVSERPPAYVRRTNELRLEAKARFEAAVKKRLAAAGRIQI